MVGQQGPSSTVPVEGAGAVDGRQAEAAADDEGVPLGASVERWEGVADRLNGRRRQGRALADVEACEPVFFLGLLHLVPHPTLALHTAVR